MEVEIFTGLLLVCSALTSLLTEAVKMVLVEHGKAYHANTLAGCCSLAVSVLVWAAQVAVTGGAITAVEIIRLVVLAVLAWLCAMLGYDKVVQAINQKCKGESE